jgi:hypothetical protein
VEGREFHEASGEWDTQGESLVAGLITAIEISAPGFGPTVVERAVACMNPSQNRIVVALGPAARVSGRVVDARDGSPVTGARVLRCVARDALGPWFHNAEAHRAQATTDERAIPAEVAAEAMSSTSNARVSQWHSTALGHQQMPPRDRARARRARAAERSHAAAVRCRPTDGDRR